MVAVGMLMSWLGYALGLEGWCLFRDYDVTLGQLMSPLHPYSGPWPPAPIPAGQIWPGGTTAASTAQGTAPPHGQGFAQGSAISEAEQAGGFLPRALRQIFGVPFRP